MKKYIAVCLVIALSILAGCGSNRTFVTERPPDPVYNRPTPPNPTFVWIGPGYVKKGGKYVYREGYWASPPNRSHHWIEGRWKQKKRGWVWVDGHWG
jgi:WXXGXW repeat (2 copies)